MGSRYEYGFDAYLRELDDWYNGLRPRAKCSIEILIRDGENDRVNIYGAYLDSLNIDGMKLTFTTVHDNKDTVIHLDKVAKVTLNKESK